MSEGVPCRPSGQSRRRWMSGTAVPPRAAGPQRYKALVPWRFQPGLVRKPLKHAAPTEPGGGGGEGLVGGVPVAQAAGSGAAPSGGGEPPTKRRPHSASAKCPDVEDGGRPGTGSGGDLGDSGSCPVPDGSGFEGARNSCGAGVGVADEEDRNLGRPNRNGSVRDANVQDFGDTRGSNGAGDGAATKLEGIGVNVGVENCVSDGLKKSCVDGTGSKSNGCSASDCSPKDPEGNCGLGDPTYCAAKENDSAAKGCSSAGPRSNGDEPYSRKGRKAVLPWRFQVGIKRPFSKAFDSDGGSSGVTKDRSTKCSPATRSTVRCYASAHSGVRVSATCDFSSAKGVESGISYQSRATDKGDHNGSSISRQGSMQSLQDFRFIYKGLLDNERQKKAVVNLASDLQAYRIFRERFSMECDKKYVGSVPGTHVGDIFHLRVELCVVGLHRPHRLSVDCIKNNDGTCVAISIVSYIQTSEIKNNLEVVVFGGAMATGNQKIEGTNLALKKSMNTKTPVRVIHGVITHLKGNFRSRKSCTYIYGGLYLVKKYWRKKECEDRYVYVFRLKKMEGQEYVDIKKILQTGKAESSERIIMEDLSLGLERIPISVANSLSDDYPIPYRYISELRRPRNYHPAPPAGCSCVGGCSDSKKCACTVKNGGEIPFNRKGLILRAKPLVYECGPSCKCPPTCHNRVGQHGMKFRLQVFKTKSMGWGVRTLDFIPCGSFVCEYIGEVLEDEEAQKRTNDEYLFGIGHNYYDESLWAGLPRSIPSLQKGPDKDDEAGFAVDASVMGNFAKFINHNCTPNLYAQNVLYDHDDKSMPRILFFACEDIRPHEELAYHYNYKIDQVHDANGNIKKKKCLCGSIECDRWLY